MAEAPASPSPGRAVYTIYTSPSHAPMPDHLPTLIVTPSGRPQNILYTYLHTNYNQENYLLTPSPNGDLCIAKLFPSSAITGAAQPGKSLGTTKAIRCEGSRALKWIITNTGIAMPTYKLTLPNSDPNSGNEDQPLFQVSKTSRTSPWWTLWYFTYAGHLIPPRRVDFGKIEKDGGGTRVVITGKSDEEKAVWKTLGDGNEDMVEWIVLCASLCVLDDEIRDAAKSAGQALRPPPPQSVMRTGSRGSSTAASDRATPSPQPPQQISNGQQKLPQNSSNGLRPVRSHSSLDSAERQQLLQQQQKQQQLQYQQMQAQKQAPRSLSPPPNAQTFPQQRSLDGAMQGLDLQGRSSPNGLPQRPINGNGRSPSPQMPVSPPRQRNMSTPADPRQQPQYNRPLVPLPQQSFPLPGSQQPRSQQQGPPLNASQDRPSAGPMSPPLSQARPQQVPQGQPPSSSRQMPPQQQQPPQQRPPNGNNLPSQPLRPGNMQAQSGPLSFRNGPPQPSTSLPTGPRMPMPMPGTSSQNVSAVSRQPISPNLEYFNSRGPGRSQQAPPSPSKPIFSPNSMMASNGMMSSPQIMSPPPPRPSFDQRREEEPESELAYARDPAPSRGPRPMQAPASSRGVQLTDVNLSR